MNNDRKSEVKESASNLWIVLGVSIIALLIYLGIKYTEQIVLWIALALLIAIPILLISLPLKLAKHVKNKDERLEEVKKEKEQQTKTDKILKIILCTITGIILLFFIPFITFFTLNFAIMLSPIIIIIVIISIITIKKDSSQKQKDNDQMITKIVAEKERKIEVKKTDIYADTAMEKENKICSKCNMKNDVTELVCIKCGNALELDEHITLLLKVGGTISLMIIFLPVIIFIVVFILLVPIMGGAAILFLPIFTLPGLFIYTLIKRFTKPVNERKKTADEIKEMLQPVKEARQVYYDETKYQNTEKKACSSCGALNVGDAKLCFICGEDLGIEII